MMQFEFEKFKKGATATDSFGNKYTFVETFYDEGDDYMVVKSNSVCTHTYHISGKYLSYTEGPYDLIGLLDEEEENEDEC